MRLNASFFYVTFRSTVPQLSSIYRKFRFWIEWILCCIFPTLKREKKRDRETEKYVFRILLLITSEKCCNLFSIKMVQFFWNVKSSWKPIYDTSDFTRNDQMSGKTRTIRKNVSYESCIVSRGAYFFSFCLFGLATCCRGNIEIFQSLPPSFIIRACS